MAAILLGAPQASTLLQSGLFENLAPHEILLPIRRLLTGQET
jgi:hypothetical protein